mmetsp:Transcript_1270/g.3898  ORF Transcript_1270/g.3898 Transcript_1270/m.3898 type:complete len:249 (-) Transcript_1270:723-1469(-)
MYCCVPSSPTSCNDTVLHSLLSSSTPLSTVHSASNTPTSRFTPVCFDWPQSAAPNEELLNVNRRHNSAWPAHSRVCAQLHLLPFTSGSNTSLLLRLPVRVSFLAYTLALVSVRGLPRTIVIRAHHRRPLRLRMSARTRVDHLDPSQCPLGLIRAPLLVLPRLLVRAPFLVPPRLLGLDLDLVRAHTNASELDPRPVDPRALTPPPQQAIHRRGPLSESFAPTPAPAGVASFADMHPLRLRLLLADTRF